MKSLRLLAYRTFHSHLETRSGWFILIAVQLILCFEFLSQVETYLQYQQQVSLDSQLSGVSEWIIKPFFAAITVMVLLIVPLMVLRLFLRNQNGNADALLNSAPIEYYKILSGVLLGILCYHLVWIVMVLLMPFSLLFFTSIDFGIFFSGFLGIILLLFFSLSLSMFCMVMINNPVTAVFSVYGVFLFFWVLSWQINQADMELLTAISVFHHIQPFLSGYFTTANLGFFSLFSVLFLLLTLVKKRSQLIP